MPGTVRVSLPALVVATLALSVATGRAATIPAYRARLDSLRWTDVSLPVKRDGFTPAPAPAPPFPAHPPTPGDKIHPLVRAAIGKLSHDPNRIDTVLVTFADPFTSSQGSVRAITGDPFSPDSALRPVLRAQSIERLKRLRDPLYQREIDTLRTIHAGPVAVLERYWISQTLLIRIRLRFVERVARIPSVMQIDPLRGESAPQPPLPTSTGCGRPLDNAYVGRALIGSDRFRGFGNGKIALLDTGVNSKHPLLKGRLGKLIACPLDPNGIASCAADDPQTDEDTGGHGTSSAVILSGNDIRGEAHRGATDLTIDSYKVYQGSAMIPASAEAAFQDAWAQGHDLIVAEVVNHNGASGLTEAANLAYDAGIMVFAANGNSRDEVTRTGTSAPANAMRAIGVGECCVTTPDVAHAGGAWGSTPDGRIKPDVAGPTGISTAPAASDGEFRSFPGTSGALPLVAGAARLLKDWMGSSGRVVTPGNVYAMILMCGQRGMVDTREGVGAIHLPGAGTIWWGPPMTIKAGDSLTVDFDVPDGSVSQLEAAIWWPEYDTSASGFPATDKKGWITLQATDPDGRWATPGDIQGSVLQRVSLRRDATKSLGTWKMSVSGRYLPEGESRQVFLAAWARP